MVKATYELACMRSLSKCQHIRTRPLRAVASQGESFASWRAALCNVGPCRLKYQVDVSALALTLELNNSWK